jgi:hypothetical protein
MPLPASPTIFEISRDGEVTLSPGLAENLCNEPYYAVRRGNR